MRWETGNEKRKRNGRTFVSQTHHSCVVTPCDIRFGENVSAESCYFKKPRKVVVLLSECGDCVVKKRKKRKYSSGGLLFGFVLFCLGKEKYKNNTKNPSYSKHQRHTLSS